MLKVLVRSLLKFGKLYLILIPNDRPEDSLAKVDYIITKSNFQEVVVNHKIIYVV